ncbi:hypothetical protein ECPA25_1265, partial [Escherichia coli PA25]
MASSTSARFFQ